MTSEGWRGVVLGAVDKHSRGDDSALDLLVRHLVEHDRGKARLIDAGVSWIGEPFPSLVERLCAELAH